MQCQGMFDGQTALVSGSSSGIGRAIAETLGEAGVDVGINYYTNRDGAMSAVEAIEAAGGSAVTIQADVGEIDGCTRLVEETRDAFGSIDILVNNAGIIHREPLESLSDGEWRRLQQVNLDSYFRLSKLVIPEMASRGDGKVVNVSSIWGRRGGANQAAYGTSKGAIDSLTKQLCHEFAPKGVRINAVSPGPIETDLNEEYIDDPEEYERVASSVPAGRWGDPKEIAEVVAFLVGPRASYIHGENVVIDGGRTI
jgi:NAD(P)-dependent dehydrogenase (short-subunit alcohol dehydrogenase family)